MEKEWIIANQYKIIRKIGEGGTARVYLAHDFINDRNVSIKILKDEDIDEKKIKKFKKEANTLSLLDNEYIVKLYDVGEDEGIHFIVAEYIDGMTLKDYIKTCSPLPVEEIVKFSKQILQGVQHAHERGLVHKDLKSQNILLDENKNVKITDFGIADALDEEVTKTQSLMGTPQYIAPEILNRDKLTTQSDIYAIGIVMYEMCLGQVPFAGEKAAYIMIKQMSQPLPSIITQRKDIPQSLENIIIRASAKKLENRYQNVEEMLVDLDKVLDPDMSDEEPLVLTDDILKNDEIERTINIGNESIQLSTLKESQTKKTNAKKQQRKIIIAVLVAIFALGAGVYLLSRGKSMDMPNLEGKTKEEAINELSTLGINEENITVTYEFNDEAEKDKVFETKPPSGSKLKKTTPITLIISKGSEAAPIEDYTGKIGTDVKSTLEAQGYKVSIVNVESDQKVGTITKQFPPAGTEVKAGDTITLEVSSGKKQIEVPNFSNMSKNEVDSWARTNSISITYESTCNSSVAADHVISQSVGYGNKINQGDQITIVLSTGACPVEEPKPSTNEESTSG